MPHFRLGESIPPDTAHAVSVSLPTWKANVSYEEGEDWVLKSMVTGYPRFFIHKCIEAFVQDLAVALAKERYRLMLFPTRKTAARCLDFVRARVSKEVGDSMKAVHLVLDTSSPTWKALETLKPAISAVIFAPDLFPIAKQYWQHSGDGVSSRRADFCHRLWRDGLLRVDAPLKSLVSRKGPRRYQRPFSIDDGRSLPLHGSNGQDQQEAHETSQFLEERFGRNLDISLLDSARSAICRRIAGALRGDLDLSLRPLPDMGANSRGIASLREEDVYLFPCGMNAIFNTHRMLLAARGSMKSVEFGFPYVDTLKTLEKFGPGCHFYGHASESDLDELEKLLEGGERLLALFCEFPGNPLLTTPNLARIRQLADKYDFAVVVDETIGTFVNINVLQHADVVVSSLTKIFSGDSNVMGGAAVFNPNGRYYADLKRVASIEYEDTYWPEDVMFMERNSRDFVSRIERVNVNAEAVSHLLKSSPLVKTVYYPKHSESRPNYDACRLPGSGYGGLLSLVFHQVPCAKAFYDTIATAKGPSLGTNFTITSPFVILAHYRELDWVESFGVDPNLIRISVGLEETEHLLSVLRTALGAADAVFERAESS